MRVGIIFGGRSGEHEVSVTSAASIFKHIDRNKYEPIAIRIDKDGAWSFPQQEPKASNVAQAIEQARAAVRDATTTRDPALGALQLDVVFPVLHGPYGEDGTIQGLLEMADLAYVGNGVLASAAGMDKSIMKLLFAGRGLPVCRALDFVRPEWDRHRDGILQRISELGLPVFVKPANLGSSVGISKVKTHAGLVPAIELALQFDRKIMVEAAVPRAREIECAVLGNDDPQTSVPGEILPSREFYDYEAKYLDDGSKTVIPADLASSHRRRGAAARGRGVSRDRRRRSGARRFPDGARHGHALPERNQYASRLHQHQHVREDVGSIRASGTAHSWTGSSTSGLSGIERSNG